MKCEDDGSILRKDVECLDRFFVECTYEPRGQNNLEGFNLGDVYTVEQTVLGFHISYWCTFYKCRFHMAFKKVFPKKYFRRIVT